MAAEWVGSTFDHRLHNPAFEIIFAYSKSDGTLDIFCRGPKKTRELLCAMFAKVMLGVDNLASPSKDERVYDLAPLQNRDFRFVHTPGDGIASIAVKRLQLVSKARNTDRVTLEADPHENPLAIHSLLDSLRPCLPRFFVQQVDIAVRLEETEKRASRVETIRLSYPNSCSLKYDELGLRLRAMLVASGIEPGLNS